MSHHTSHDVAGPLRYGVGSLRSTTGGTELLGRHHSADSLHVDGNEHSYRALGLQCGCETHHEGHRGNCQLYRHFSAHGWGPADGPVPFVRSIRRICHEVGAGDKNGTSNAPFVTVKLDCAFAKLKQVPVPENVPVACVLAIVAIVIVPASSLQ